MTYVHSNQPQFNKIEVYIKKVSISVLNIYKHVQLSRPQFLLRRSTKQKLRNLFSTSQFSSLTKKLGNLDNRNEQYLTSCNLFLDSRIMNFRKLFEFIIANISNRFYSSIFLLLPQLHFQKMSEIFSIADIFLIFW